MCPGCVDVALGLAATQTSVCGKIKEQNKENNMGDESMVCIYSPYQSTVHCYAPGMLVVIDYCAVNINCEACFGWIL